jgi:hypothetical protein
MQATCTLQDAQDHHRWYIDVFKLAHPTECLQSSIVLVGRLHVIARLVRWRWRGDDLGAPARAIDVLLQQRHSRASANDDATEIWEVGKRLGALDKWPRNMDQSQLRNCTLHERAAASNWLLPRMRADPLSEVRARQAAAAELCRPKVNLRAAKTPNHSIAVPTAAQCSTARQDMPRCETAREHG